MEKQQTNGVTLDAHVAEDGAVVCHISDRFHLRMEPTMSIPVRHIRTPRKDTAPMLAHDLMILRAQQDRILRKKHT